MQPLKELVEQLDKIVRLDNNLLNTIRIEALISANWESVRQALLAWDGKERSNLEHKEQQ